MKHKTGLSILLLSIPVFLFFSFDTYTPPLYIYASGKKDGIVQSQNLEESLLIDEITIKNNVLIENQDFIQNKDAFIIHNENDFVIVYPKQITPGDPFFITIYAQKIIQNGNALIRKAEKNIAKASFFMIDEYTYTAGIALSTWVLPDLYSVEIIINTNDDSHMFIYTINIEEKKFISETIELNNTNTTIRTDNSEEKNQQIKKLNDILFSINKKALWATKAFSYPVISTRRTSFFGDRRIFVYSNGTSATSLHYGIDFGIPTGTPIYACADGYIVLAENRISTGWSVVIEHLPGLYSLYYHMDKIDVIEGQEVNQQDFIGLSGATGLATGPHLHWEIRLNGEAVNPDFFVEHEIIPIKK